MSPEVVLFDLDDTLVIDQSSAEAAFLATSEIASKTFGCNPNQLTRAVWDNVHNLWYAAPTIKYCQGVGIRSWEGLWSHFSGDDPNLKFLKEWVSDYRRRVWFQALSTFGIENMEFAQYLGDTLIAERRNRHFLFSDTKECLEQLRGRYRLGIITNGSSDHQREKIERTGIAGFFDIIIISEEVGIGKPDTRIFNLALEQLTINPEATVLVGDSLEMDIQGARDANIRTVWINRSHTTTNDQKIVPDIQIHSLDELTGIL
ncbi:hypothetical protein A3B42_02400 [Candidatus Daviesbacteria bacterium RIFCSPLOWO2_01_FULL_38_10]|nr:MAG: hypothetical protein A3D02_03275 [Candidatus Daviesbacteria bacterium RIFCSPHIGHO2_02_FULL_39_41]OGE39590.1 MAG: hypothetical protein A3B42_02400 [Candidatus Daviesbacteria bacterium RIFCSPLOWO2_01_FULL_38_10]OGE45453.1 MAG: hypothetical protein A3E67_00140 [Candidatus Daviesbacteria bacterium RIFCSPHIGHO2_12_FULL_38_25]OGE68765.1 MAG: hypothetical protein A3H81_06155 [Candidatus Daviesbacteria bacterium RIFCSPLOWO2_02_FULL_38_18]OGE73502.1 MAG: hypothetical protein A3H18_05785 [Candida